MRKIKVTQKFQKSIFENFQEFWSEFCSPRESSAKKPYNIFRCDQNPESCGTSVNQKFQKSIFEKLQQFWSKFCFPPEKFCKKAL